MLTLTYDRAHLPPDGSLRPEELRSFFMRLRRYYLYQLARPGADNVNAPAQLRFFSCGEYGGQFGRPHYHAICFGADRTTVVNGESFSKLVHRSWSRGSTHLGGGWNANTAAYVSGYVAKGHNVAGLDLLEGRHPEFARWPNRPGLGVPGLDKVLPQLLRGREVHELVAELGDLPSIAFLGDRPRPLGGYLMQKARLLAGLSLDESIDIKRRASARLSSDHRSEFLTAALAEAVASSDGFADRFAAALSSASSADHPLASWSVVGPLVRRSVVRKLNREATARAAGVAARAAARTRIITMENTAP